MFGSPAQHSKRLDRIEAGKGHVQHIVRYGRHEIDHDNDKLVADYCDQHPEADRATDLFILVQRIGKLEEVA